MQDPSNQWFALESGQVDSNQPVCHFDGFRLKSAFVYTSRGRAR